MLWQWQYLIIGCTKEHEKTLRAKVPSSNILLAQDLGWACAELAPQHVLIFDMLLKSPGVPETPLCKNLQTSRSEGARLNGARVLIC